jgi:hypothetical protein
MQRFATPTTARPFVGNPIASTTHSSPVGHEQSQHSVNRISRPESLNEPPEEHTGAQIVSAAIEHNNDNNDNHGSLPFYIGM